MQCSIPALTAAGRGGGALSWLCAAAARLAPAVTAAGLGVITALHRRRGSIQASLNASKVSQIEANDDTH